jgi:DNA sulfur modification protein DndB
VTLAKGIGGVQYGTRPVLIEKDAVPQLTKVATEWFEGVASVVGSAIENRVKSVASASSVMAAIGAVGHPLVDVLNDSERAKKRAGFLELLRQVRWDKGKTWEGIAGKFTPKGNFSIAGAKDTSYAVYAALTDATSEGYSRIRAEGLADELEYADEELVGA